MALPPQVVGSIIGAGSGLVNTGLNFLGMNKQVQASKDLMDYQWQKFQSPQAQVRAMTAAGLNPAAMFGDGKGAFAAPSVGMPSSVPVQVDGVADMANYLTAVANAKKSGVETKNLEVERQSKEFELELSKWFSAPEKVANITLAWKNAVLRDDEHSINEFKKVFEKYLSELKGIERDSAQKVYENMDTVIQQENKQREEGIKLTQEKQKTEGTMQSANRAAAAASNASAKLSMSQVDINKELKEIRHIEREVAETGKLDQIDSLLSRYRADKMISDKEYEQARKLYESAKLFNEKGDKSRAVRLMYAMFDLLGEEIGNLSPIKPK